MYCTNWFAFWISMLWVDYGVVITKGCCPYLSGEERKCCPWGRGLLWLLALQCLAEAVFKGIFKAPRGLLQEINGFGGQAPCAAGLCGRRAAQVRRAGGAQAFGALGARTAPGGRAPGLGWLSTRVRLASHRVSEPFPRGPGTLRALCGPWRGCRAGLAPAGLRALRSLGREGTERSAPGWGAGCEVAAGFIHLCAGAWGNKKGTWNRHMTQVITCSTAMGRG